MKMFFLIYGKMWKFTPHAPRMPLTHLVPLSESVLVDQV